MTDLELDDIGKLQQAGVTDLGGVVVQGDAMSTCPQLADALNYRGLSSYILQHLDHNEIRRQRKIRYVPKNFGGKVDVDRLTARQPVETDFERGTGDDLQRCLPGVRDFRLGCSRRRSVQQLKRHDGHGGVIDRLAGDKYVVLRCRCRWSVSPAAVFYRCHVPSGSASVPFIRV